LGFWAKNLGQLGVNAMVILLVRGLSSIVTGLSELFIHCHWIVRDGQKVVQSAGQWGVNAMVNTTSHPSHPGSIHGQPTVNATDNGQTTKNNPQITTNNTKQ